MFIYAVYRVYMGIMEKKIETIIFFFKGCLWFKGLGFLGFRVQDYMGIMEKKMEMTIVY